MHLSGTNTFNEEVERNRQVLRTLIERVDKLCSTMKEIGNPFMEDTDSNRY